MDKNLKLFFLNTYSDIERKVESAEPYDLIKAAGLLRLLFLDGYPLVHQINRELKIPVIFHVSDYKLKPPITNIWVHWFSLLPETEKTYKVNLREFLRIEPLIYRNQEYSVKEIIQSASHLMGGVHYGKAETEKEQVFLNLEELMPLFPALNTASLKSIAEVSLEALKPLIEKVK